MCKHIFDYPIDKEDNYNPDKETLVGVCRGCGLKQISYGMRGMIPKYDESWQDPFDRATPLTNDLRNDRINIETGEMNEESDLPDYKKDF